MKVLSLFDGIGIAKVALEKEGFDIKQYIRVEIDPEATKTYKKNHPKKTKHFKDVKDFDGKPYENKIDLLIGGSPCQDFSRMKNKGKGLNGERSGLFYEYIRILKEVKPKYFILENVKMKKRHEKIITKLLGVEPIFINADLFVPQNRPRLFWTNIPVLELPTRPNWTDHWRVHRGGKDPNGAWGWRENKKNVAHCLTTSRGESRKIEKNGVIQSIEDCEPLMGLPRGYTSGVSKGERWRQLGNGFVVDVIAHILKGIKD